MVLFEIVVITFVTGCFILLLMLNYWVFVLSINGDKVYTHRGERSEEDIVEFVKKASGSVCSCLHLFKHVPVWVVFLTVF